MNSLDRTLLSRFFVFSLVFIINGYMDAAVNTVRITEKSGITTANYPVQLGRPFLKGEITNYPQVLINGSPIVTQTNVMQRYDDGSVKHAILCFLIPVLEANSAINVTFQDQSTGNDANYLTKQQMLDSSYDFNAIMELTNGTTVSASARTMLNDDHFTYWLKGPVATSVIFADHSINRTYDIGFDSCKSIRPIFHATFWPGLHKVRLRFIGEVSNTEVFQDQRYSLALKTGNSSPQEVFFQDTITHYAGTRWTKEFWLGEEPSTIDIDYNIAYLAETRFIPNYDTTKVISESAIASEYTTWTNAQKGLYAQGNWNKSMPAGGGRPDIGPYPDWTVKWLYTGDHRMREKALGNADLAGAWSMHFREGNANKIFLLDSTVPGIGKVLSIHARPTVWLDPNRLTWYEQDQEDRITIVGANTVGGWIPDCAHQAETYSPQYFLTGDFWYLEQLYFWVSWSAANSNGGGGSSAVGRGPTGAEGGINNQIRGQAWALRTRANAAFVAPDDHIEKRYFETILDGALAIWEGARNITGTPFENNVCWTWGHDKWLEAYGVPSLNQWEIGGANFAQIQYGIDTSIVQIAESNFEQHFMMFALGRAEELGYPTAPLGSYLAVNYTGQLTNPDYNPYLVSNGRIPTVKKNGEQFSSWAELKTGYVSEWQATDSFYLSNAVHGYEFLALAAVSYISDEPGGDSAWAFMEREVLTAEVLSNNPKWAIVPRMDGPYSALNKTTGPNKDMYLTVNPNPFNPMVNIWLNNDQRNTMRTVRIFTVKGELVADLAATIENTNRTVFHYTWNAGNMPSSIYIVKARIADRTFTRKITLLR
ncbi:MAG: hypothetical protein A2268_06330 [Candidatus Raymondbacteria bacterium RifOxyA12_full_50_37]|uniref:Secretion system C-terminal sorting domain-containing protein n=1 Tax=Candidatus Raymondbacteria bacterium RIFOXYD12_FULL_49_13 TaxID=1817890 RepID=A0A1F7FER3_UNCRA|nr:MAG: hypothetical protein A2268_06330 [Candidatus Raymondbacteria bacterium RifOxyA12_full_50_37]OGJ92700.1 MAG: hypothetical protein A2487_09610 [Candidatus Raymondbacteria bacterium RifOxyC12_full_50_8]OGJ94428.1 MAG: hypothetical protein A2248_15260 [Candidatus Raymondbacteria bacterium RIFOXYA2_FULL_49_16]OGJ99184.1 MAG: hypothetical protein A2453_07110 [Candidatus Raymondbacteria bacterium RIFOXYC2_FULL_50_21]OGK01138.1 MAG: hypothetical protein A2350_10155 [Candidatus Raymondbacteria b